MTEDTIHARPCTVHGRAFFLWSVGKFMATARVIEPGELAIRDVPVHIRRGGNSAAPHACCCNLQFPRKEKSHGSVHRLRCVSPTAAPQPRDGGGVGSRVKKKALCLRHLFLT